MSDSPFGFGPADRDPDRNPDRDPDRDPDKPDSGGQDPARGPADPFGFGAGFPGLPGLPGLPGDPGTPGTGGFDLGQLGQMLTQLGQMLSQGSGAGGGPVNYDLAKQLAVQHLSSSAAVTAEQRSAVSDAVRLAELWLDPVTYFPAGARTGRRRGHRRTGSRRACRRGNGCAIRWPSGCPPRGSTACPRRRAQMAGPMLAMLGQMGGLAFGSQLGNGLAQLSAEVLTSTEIGICRRGRRARPRCCRRPSRRSPRASAVRPARSWSTSRRGRRRTTGCSATCRGCSERLLARSRSTPAGIPWTPLASRSSPGGIDPANPSALAGGHAVRHVRAETTPEQKAALARLETLLALVEGWVDAVVTEAVGDRLPGADALRETLRRRRASGGPAEQTFATRRRARAAPAQAARRRRAVAAAHGAVPGCRRRGTLSGRTRISCRPSMISTTPRASSAAAELGDDPIAELERTEQREADDAASDDGAEGQAKD